MEISKIISSLLLRFPLFGSIIVNLNFELTNQAIKSPAFTNGKTIYYKQEFIDNYSFADKEFTFAHEIFHVVLQHSFRNAGKDKDLLNFVADGIINQLLLKSGLTMPEGLEIIVIPDALDYSVDELYMKYLPNLEEIRNLMKNITYHIDIDADWISEIYNKDLQQLMANNETLKNELLGGFNEDLANKAKFGNEALGLEFPSVKVGYTKPILSWQELLKASLISPDETTTVFYEIEKDGIIRKEENSTIASSESEIIIDTSGSMSMAKIKVILRECKNILLTSEIKVGFCDAEFYGWHEIVDDNDIDNLHITGRGGTNFKVMAESFSEDVDNKIVITDGFCIFPKDHGDILWIILNDSLPNSVNSSEQKINYIFINEKEVLTDNYTQKLMLK